MKLILCMVVFVLSGVAYGEDEQTLIDDTKQVKLSEKESAETQKVTQALEKFSSDCGRLPTTEEGLLALLIKPKTLKCKSWKSYLAPMPEKDLEQWRYVVTKRGAAFELKRAGGKQ